MKKSCFRFLLKTFVIGALITVSTLEAKEIKIGAIFDLSGGLNVYGTQQSKALHLAVENINNEGGLYGNKIKVIEYDSQSELSKYTQFANTLIRRDKITALFAGLTSSSREALRPLVRRAKLPYFYGSLYEGGACDKYTFVTGSSASQGMKNLIKWGIKEYGKRIFIMAPSYNFGTISGHWVKEYAKQFGAQVVGEDYLSLTLSDFSPTIQKIQRAKPDFVVALPVGTNQNGFLEQFTAAGLKGKIGVVSTNHGSGNQQIVLSPKAGNGIVATSEYFEGINNKENDIFKAAWIKKYGDKETIIPGAVNIWNAVNIWAKAVNNVKTTASNVVIKELESGLSFDAPNGKVTMLASHHLQQNIYLSKGNMSQKFDLIHEFKAVLPEFEDAKCDLVKFPKLVKHFTPIK